MNEDNIKKINDEIEDLEKKIYSNRVNKIGNTLINNTTMGVIRYDLTDDGTGKKYDDGKSMVGTLVNVFPNALMAIGMCIEFGTHKYPKSDNWKKVKGASKRYQNSLMRHLIKHNVGIEKDSETGIIHLAHMAWNALAILELYLMEHPEIAKEYLK